ncbi:ABC transporter ATP-binding protein [Uruburuella testudinis]|uniref:ABC transporter ATP-binding protein n=1 Tax=Uruburuella testudinis TaxID=1282863 RepID=A0ABY4DTB5_9NEIS|nr:ABC transporter ATP-binding protein [Uruburuella testudinis]UOO82291.1 ABC transporter ATP-binding protein [Uruburuella testudinis]
MSLQVAEGKITVFIGTNGCGKSTLLKALARQLKPAQGRVTLNGENVLHYPGKKFAKQLAMLAQSPNVPEGISAHQLVRYGRYPHQRLTAGWQPEDDAAVADALALTQTGMLAERAVNTLSGGQRQRVWIAMALAQDTPYLLLDEPTTYLDLAYQIDVLELLQKLNRETGKTIVMVLHDLNLACRYADEIIALCNGGVYLQGPPEKVMTEATVKAVFGLNNKMIADPIYGTPMCVPYGSR